jgi:hypothetical protein
LHKVKIAVDETVSNRRERALEQVNVLHDNYFGIVQKVVQFGDIVAI